MNNLEIRFELMKRNITQRKAAVACGVTEFTFCRWLRYELPQDKKEKILEVIRNYEA